MRSRIWVRYVIDFSETKMTVDSRRSDKTNLRESWSISRMSDDVVHFINCSVLTIVAKYFTLQPSSPEKEAERDIFLYRAYIAQVSVVITD